MIGQRGYMRVGGPVFEPTAHGGFVSVHGKAGAHYNQYHMDVAADGRTIDREAGMRNLRMMFPKGEATEYEFVLFSTSGVHGTYTTIEEIEASLTVFGDDPDPQPEDFEGYLTVLVVHHRIVCTRHAQVRVRLADVPWLKRLRRSSWDAMLKVGAPSCR